MGAGVKADKSRQYDGTNTSLISITGSPIADNPPPPRGLKHTYLRYLRHTNQAGTPAVVSPGSNPVAVPAAVLSPGGSHQVGMPMVSPGGSHQVTVPMFSPRSHALAVPVPVLCTEGYVFDAPGVYTMEVAFDASLLPPGSYGRYPDSHP